MPEDQLTVLPPEVRQMVMTGATALMSGAGANPAGMMGAPMNPMMDMSGMMGMDPLGMMAEGQVPAPVEQAQQMGMADAFAQGAGGAGMMGMGVGVGMGADFGMQVLVFSHSSFLV
jgi:pre-mRNA 3'-end-processing factor FIP1